MVSEGHCAGTLTHLAAGPQEPGHKCRSQLLDRVSGSFPLCAEAQMILSTGFSMSKERQKIFDSKGVDLVAWHKT